MVQQIPVENLSLFIRKGFFGIQATENGNPEGYTLEPYWQPMHLEQTICTFLLQLPWNEKLTENEVYYQSMNHSHLWLFRLPVFKLRQLLESTEEVFKDFGLSFTPFKLDIVPASLYQLARYNEDDYYLYNGYTFYTPESKKTVSSAVGKRMKEIDGLALQILTLSNTASIQFVNKKEGFALLIQLVQNGIKLYYSQPGINAYTPASKKEVQLMASLLKNWQADWAVGFDFTNSSIHFEPDINCVDIALGVKNGEEEIEGVACKITPGSMK